MRKNTLCLFIVISLLGIGFSVVGQQTQSKLLNIPIQPYGTATPGNQSIDFRNLSAITTCSWPVPNNANYQAFITNQGFVPQNDGDLEDYFIVSYCGQAPRFASQNFTDLDGNLLYFIVDNYIYDNTGLIFDYLDEDAYPILHTSYDIDEVVADDMGLYHNIIIIPDDNDCDKYYTIFATQGLDCEMPDVNYGEFHFPKGESPYYLKVDTLHYGDKGRLIDGINNFSMGANNPEGETDNLLFTIGGGKLTVRNFSDPNLPSIELQLNTVYSTPIVNCNRPDLSVIDFGPDNHLLATSMMKPVWNPITEEYDTHIYVVLITVPKDFSNISQQTIEQNYIDVGGLSCFGFEFAKNGQYVYYTKQSASPKPIQYIDLTGCYPNYDVSQVDITDINSLNITGDFRNTELEMGRDGKLYAITSTGSITAISNTDNPTSATATDNNFELTCNKMNLFAKVGNDDMSYCFSHQLDGSTYNNLLPFNYSSTAINWNVYPYNQATQTWSPGINNNPFGSVSGEVYLNSNLTIPSGKYITLQNMVIHFDIGKNVTVNTGSTLRLTNSILTSNNTCNTDRMWTGVILNGNGSLSQATANQGRLSMAAPSEISNAVCAVNVGSGAICYVTSGTFKNNRSSIRFSPYTYTPVPPSGNASLLQTADFIIDKALHDGSTPTEQVYVNNVKGIKIYYCDFINSRDNSVEAEYRGTAIATTAGTSYKVLGASNMTNYIQGFKYAINSNQPAAASIRKVNFNNNYRGVYLVSPTTPIVESNNFNTYDFANSSSYISSDPNTYPYGCYIYGNGTNTTFTFESNVVTAEFPALGLYVNNSGANANEVRDNVFQGTGSGTSDKILFSCINLAKNSNWNGSIGGDIGLQYKCNIFENYNSALSVVDGNIRNLQGQARGLTITTYAGNGFDRSTSMAEGDFYVDLNIVPSSLDLGNYTYCSNADGLVNGYYHKLQNYLSIPLGKVNNLVGNYYESTHCEELMLNGGTIQTLISVIEGSELVEQIDNEKVLMEYDLALLIDNGNTAQLLTDVENVNPASDDEVSEKVADAEGYISDEVALTYLENDNANQYAKAEALLANSPLPSKIVAEIENAPIDDNLKSLLILNQNGVNAREAKEIQIAELHQNRRLVVNAMVRVYWDENAIDENRAQLKNFLISDNEIVSQQHLFDIYLYEKNYTAASECLAKIEDLAYICNMDYIIELENNNNVLRLMMEIEQGNISLDEAVAQNIDLLRAMKSENEVAGSVYAAILLDMAKVEPMTEVIRLPEPAVEQKNAVANKTSNFNASFSDLVNIYPNPASDFVYVEYILTDVNNYKSVNLYNASGSLIKYYPVSQKAGYVKIDVNDLSAGTYIVSIGENGGKFSKQIVIQ